MGEAFNLNRHKVELIGTTKDEEHGEWYARYMRITPCVDKAWVDEWLPATHCQHEYDCCGNFYSYPARVIGDESQGTIVAQSWFRNI